MGLPAMPKREHLGILQNGKFDFENNDGWIPVLGHGIPLVHLFFGQSQINKVDRCEQM